MPTKMHGEGVSCKLHAKLGWVVKEGGRTWAKRWLIKTCLLSLGTQHALITFFPIMYRPHICHKYGVNTRERKMHLGPPWIRKGSWASLWIMIWTSHQKGAQLLSSFIPLLRFFCLAFVAFLLLSYYITSKATKYFARNFWANITKQYFLRSNIL